VQQLEKEKIEGNWEVEANGDRDGNRGLEYSHVYQGSGHGLRGSAAFLGQGAAGLEEQESACLHEGRGCLRKETKRLN
jgi:hypothetical protein